MNSDTKATDKIKFAPHSKTGHTPSLDSGTIQNKVIQPSRGISNSNARTNTRDFQATRCFSILCIDIATIILSFLCANYIASVLRWLAFDHTQPLVTSAHSTGLILVGLLPTLFISGLSAFWGHYNRRLPYWIEVRDLIKAVIYSSAITSLVLFALKLDFSRFWAVCFFCILVLSVPIGRLVSRHALKKLGIWTKSTVIIGDGPLAFSRARTYCDDTYLGLEVSSYVDLSSHTRIRNLSSLLRYGDEFSVEDFGARGERPHIVVAVEDLQTLTKNKKGFDAIMSTCTSMTFIPPITGIPLYNSQLIQGFRGDVATFRLQNNLKRTSSKVLKRSLDLILCLTGIVILTPAILVIAVLVKLDGGPLFFGQERIGTGGKLFVCWKFRSMQMDADTRLKYLLKNNQSARDEWNKDHKLKDDPRITKIGAFLRKTSLDEIPQFWNVIRNEMSLIGPRPIVKAEIVKYGSDFDYYSEAKPGITGLWQISGRNDLTYSERVALDVWYVRNWSPWLDIVIAIKTVPILVFGVGAY